MATREATALARLALEQVCSGGDPTAAVGVYSSEFRDHVNARDYRGHEGISESLALYQLVFSDGDLRIRVEDQVTEGSRSVRQGPSCRMARSLRTGPPRIASPSWGFAGSEAAAPDHLP